MEGRLPTDTKDVNLEIQNIIPSHAIRFLMLEEEREGIIRSFPYSRSAFLWA